MSLFPSFSSFVSDKSHQLIATGTATVTTAGVLSWSLDIASRCLVGLVIAVGSWLITTQLSKWMKSGKL